MATLKSMTRTLIELCPHHRFGRAPDMTTHLPFEGVSLEHAVIHWTGEGWTLEDLGSEGGTFIGDARLAPNAPCPLSRGAIIAFGSPPQRFFVTDLSAPLPKGLLGDELIVGEDGFLALPSESEPTCIVRFEHPNGWMASQGEERWSVAGGDTFTLGDTPVTLDLPMPKRGTAGQEAFTLPGAPFALTFKGSPGEPPKGIDVTIGHQQHPMAPEPFHALLRLLALNRLPPEGESPQWESDHGWVEMQGLTAPLGLEANQVYVAIQKARRALGRLDGLDPRRIIEERTGPQAFRIGTPILQMTLL